LREDETMSIRSIVILLVIAAPLRPMLPGGAHAQPLDLKAPPPARERIAPAVPERDLYPSRPSVPHRPTFFGPLSRKTDRGRAGISGFTAPNPPVGSRVAGDHGLVGWPGVGFAVEWGGSDRQVN
jgi:hypothetical protein